MPAVDAKLAKALLDAKTKEFQFALVYKSATEGQLFVGKSIPSSDIQEAKKQIKGAKFIEGKCIGNGKGIIFEGVTDSGVLSVIEKLAKSLAGVNIDALEDKPEAEGAKSPKDKSPASDVEEEASETETSEVPEEPAKDPKLGKGLREAVKEERSFGLVVGGPQEGRLIVRSKEVKTSDLKKILTEIGGSKIFRGTVKKNDKGIYLFTATQKAASSLKQVIQLLAQRDGGIPIKAAMAFGPGPALVEWDAKSAQIGAQLKLLSKSPPANLSELLQKFGAAQALSKAEEYEDALEALEPLEQLLKASQEQGTQEKETEEETEQETTESAAVDKVQFVKLQQARLRWDGVRKDLQAAIENLQAELAGQPPEYAELASGLNVVLQNYDESLLDTLDAALNAADPEVRQMHHSRVLEIIEEYSTLAQDDELLAHLSKNPFFPGKAFAEVSKALQELSGQLRA